MEEAKTQALVEVEHVTIEAFEWILGLDGGAHGLV